jgi:hypothetical protein
MTVIYSIENLHSESCGEPPRIERPENGYFSYYENKHGEQWFLVGDYDSMNMILVGGDAEWKQFAINWDTIYFCECVLNSFERRWLDSCVYTFFTFAHKESDIKAQMSKIRRRHLRRVDSLIEKLLREAEASTASGKCAN